MARWAPHLAVTEVVQGDLHVLQLVEAHPPLLPRLQGEYASQPVSTPEPLRHPRPLPRVTHPNWEGGHWPSKGLGSPRPGCGKEGGGGEDTIARKPPEEGSSLGEGSSCPVVAAPVGLRPWTVWQVGCWAARSRAICPPQRHQPGEPGSWSPRAAVASRHIHSPGASS